METRTTKGIKISVEVFYQAAHSNPMDSKYVYAYKISITNTTRDVVQLLRRHWMITDSNRPVREVKGEGVIGKQPVLESGEQHQYVSWCNLFSDVGKMEGTYVMLNRTKGTMFRVVIPPFKMVFPYKLN